MTWFFFHQIKQKNASFLTWCTAGLSTVVHLVAAIRLCRFCGDCPSPWVNSNECWVALHLTSRAGSSRPHTAVRNFASWSIISILKPFWDSEGVHSICNGKKIVKMLLREPLRRLSLRLRPALVGSRCARVSLVPSNRRKFLFFSPYFLGKRMKTRTQRLSKTFEAKRFNAACRFTHQKWHSTVTENQKYQRLPNEEKHTERMTVASTKIHYSDMINNVW